MSANLRYYIIDAARQLGMDPVDLATIISYETGGTFDPAQPGPTTKWGQHRGWIQWGEPQAREYGVDFTNPASQADAIVRYYRDRGWKPGMSNLDAYSIVNAGRPGLYNAVDGDTTVAEKVASFGPHRQKAETWLAADGDMWDGMATVRPAFAPETPAPPTIQDPTDQWDRPIDEIELDPDPAPRNQQFIIEDDRDLPVLPQGPSISPNQTNAPPPGQRPSWMRNTRAYESATPDQRRFMDRMPARTPAAGGKPGGLLG